MASKPTSSVSLFLGQQTPQSWWKPARILPFRYGNQFKLIPSSTAPLITATPAGQIIPFVSTASARRKAQNTIPLEELRSNMKRYKLNSDFVESWSKMYPVEYDVEFYDPYIDFRRRGDPCALRRLMEWKNVSKAGTPMELWKPQNKAFKKFLSRLHLYLGKGGGDILRNDFRGHAPVYSIFWSHILFRTPIFDRYTNVAFQYFANGKRVSKEDAIIRAGSHWIIYDDYAKWFTREQTRLKIRHSRKLDRALFVWGKELAKGARKNAVLRLHQKSHARLPRKLRR